MSILKGEQAEVLTIYNTITVPSGRSSRTAYLSRPNAGGEWPTVLVISGPGPITSAVKEVCRRVARQGFAVLAPETRVGTDNLDLFIDYVANPAADWSSAEYGLGTLGLGRGGSAALEAAVQYGQVLATMTVATAPDLELLPSVRVPMLALVGDGDVAVTPDIVERARNLAPHVEWVVYRGLDDDWWNDAAPGWDEEAASDSLTRVADFFGTHLPPLL